MHTGIARHLPSDTPRVMIVDGSRVVRRMIEQLLLKELPGVSVVSCGSGSEALQALLTAPVDFVTTALRLPDMDGMELARTLRQQMQQAYMPIVVVSGDVTERLEARALGEDVTDYFDKALGFPALAAFIRGYVRPEQQASGAVLYVEDSRVVALATRRMMEKCGLTVLHSISAEDALALLESARAQGRVGADVVLTDVNLKGTLSGADLIARVRGEFGYGRGRLPILVMTGDDNPRNQAALLKSGANDLVQKPIEERLLITKLLFQLRVSQHLRQRDGIA
ncbi:response regulator [Metallibacterium sp.]|jgi:CheY-like chemotaxis protein|uniref:response regulator n=1 Tax=Metallibacterium sp. TaxID=2940281 RepID=UPI00260F07E4|nr:response regulator [Metallibacterium sp.]